MVSYLLTDRQFSKETNLANQLKSFLLEEEWNIFQLVSPGGQAHFSITYSIDRGAKTIFPDLVAYKPTEVLIGEIKPKFSEEDYVKLSSIFESSRISQQLRKNLSRRLKGLTNNFVITPLLVHGDQRATAHPKIDQLILGSTGYYIPKS